MKIELRIQDVRMRAKELYSGHSKPISDLYANDEPLKIEWWMNQPQVEGPHSVRQKAALRLYLEVGGKSKPTLPANSFPALFDCDGGKSLRPDKAIIKVFLMEGLIVSRRLGAQLIFDVTDAGISYAGLEK